MASFLRLLRCLPAVGLFALLLTSTAAAQKLGSKYVEDTTHGFKFKYLKNWSASPPNQERAPAGMFFRADSEGINVKLPGNQITQGEVSLFLIRFDQPVAVTNEGNSSGLRARTGGESKRPEIGEVFASMFANIRDFEKDKPVEDPEIEKLKKGLTARHIQWKAFDANGFDLYVDTWTIHLDDYDICFLWMLPDQRKDNKKWFAAFEKSVKTFQLIDKVEAEIASLEDDSSYQDILTFHREEAERTPGWTALPTPSKEYVIKTSSDDKKFIKEVIERLESSRKLFERDFPPAKPIGHISVVRICSDLDEFRKYGGIGGGAVGFFSPSSTELVLFDARETNRNKTFAVMTHEAFHQYCHFLFNESAAHRWFDEGHGDYYGGVEFKGRRAIITPRMPSGLDRLPGARQMIRDDEMKPLWVHINYDHQQWQNQGPTGVEGYQQSWSLIYFLRQGALGKVSSAVWEKEYANIIPNYIKTLSAGYEEAYEEQRGHLRELLEHLQGDENAEERKSIEERMKHPRVGGEIRDEIWEKAMEASWGQIDVEVLEESWKKYVMDYLK